MQLELHNDAVMRELRQTGEQLKQEAAAIGRDVKDAAGSATSPVAENILPAKAQNNPTDKPAA